jgi:hypothetical protein
MQPADMVSTINRLFAKKMLPWLQPLSGRDELVWNAVQEASLAVKLKASKSKIFLIGLRPPFFAYLRLYQDQKI